MKASPVQKKSVMITGCSSGIGRASARLLRNHGWLVVPTARTPSDLDSLRAEGFDPVAFDAADGDSIANAAREVLSKLGGHLGAVVNNAGFGLTSAVEDSTRTMWREVFEVNVFGLQELTRHLIPLFRRQGYGRIVNISSVLGELSLPLVGIYSASKYAVEALSDALRRELFDSGVSVSIIQPGPIKTRFSKNLALRTEQHPLNPGSPFAAFYLEAIQTRKTEQGPRTAERFIKPPEAVAEKILHALESPRPKIRYRITSVAHVGAFARRALPAAWLDAVLMDQLKKKVYS